MKRFRLAAALSAAAFLHACGPPGKDEEAENAANNAEQAEAEVEGKAEEGRISFKAPGFDFAIDVPGGLAKEARADRDNKLLYPGSAIGGVHIGAAPAGKSGAQSEVDLRFSTADPLDRVLAWYRDPARAEGFQLQKAERDGDAHVLAGLEARDRHPFKLRLAPRPGGGTEGRLTVHHHD